MIDKARTVEAQVVVGDSCLEEYTDAMDDSLPDGHIDKTQLAYIIAETGKEFHVTFSLLPGGISALKNHGLKASLYVDGNFCSGSHVNQSKAKTPGCKYKLRYFDEKRDPNGTKQVRKLFFAPLQTIEGAPPTAYNKETLSKMKEIGAIRLDLWIADDAGSDDVCANASNDQTRTEIYEKALKGGGQSHSVGFSSAQTQRANFVKTTKISFLARFIFKYRSEDALRALRILPARPLTPRSDDGDIESMTIEQLRELARRQRTQIKREIDDNDRDDATNGAEERGVSNGPGRRKRTKREPLVGPEASRDGDGNDVAEVVAERRAPRLSYDNSKPIDLTND